MVSHAEKATIARADHNQRVEEGRCSSAQSHTINCVEYSAASQITSGVGVGAGAGSCSTQMCTAEMSRSMKSANDGTAEEVYEG